MHLFGQTILEDILTYICENLEESYTRNQCNFKLFLKFNILKLTLGEKHTNETKCEYFHPSIQVEDTFWNPPYPIFVIFLLQPQFEAKKLYTGKCVNLRQKLSLDKTECRILHCMQNSTQRFFAFQLEKFTFSLIFCRASCCDSCDQGCTSCASLPAWL